MVFIDWRANNNNDNLTKHFEKLIVKPGTHAPQQLIKQPNISKVKTKLILDIQ